MKLEDFQKMMDEEDRIERARPWYVRIPKKVFNFVWYRMILNFPSVMRDLKWKYQRMIRGYSECDVWNLSHFIIEKIHDPFIKFIRYEEEHGNSLPMDFASDPAAWLVVLSKIEYSIEHAWREDNDYDYDIISTMTPTQLEEHSKKMAEGFALFGKYLMDLWD